MEDHCSTEIDHEEFECAECDYKARTEAEMIDHSEIHRGEEDDMVDSTCWDIYTPGKSINKITQMETALVSFKNECDRLRGIKRGHDLFQTNFSIIDQSKNICGNKKIKLEEIDIDKNYTSCFSLGKIIINEAIKEEQDPLETEKLLSNNQSQYFNNNDPMRRKYVIPGVIVEVDNTGKYIPDGWERKVYRVTEGTCVGSYRAIYITPTGELLKSKKEVSQHIEYLKNIGIRSSVQMQKIDFTTSSQIKQISVYKTNRVELEVDNSNVYIPDGWERKAFAYLGCVRNRKIYYISPFNKGITSCNSMRQYLDQLESEGHNVSVDIERLNFSLKTLIEKKEQKIRGEDIDIDNTGKYIPDGWQRKVFRRAYGPAKGSHGTYYISSTGTKLYGKTDALAHIKLSEKRGIKSLIDVEKLDFKTSSHNLLKTEKKKQIEKEEIELDNTNVYIPEGWKRKAYNYISDKGIRCGGVYYISPFNKQIASKKLMKRYLATLVKKGHFLKVKIKLLNFYKKGIV